MRKYETTDRITVDVDGESGFRQILPMFKLIEIMNKIRTKIKNWRKVEIIRSPSGHGFHVYIHLNKEIKYSTQFKYRKMLGDCPVRLMLSKRDLKKGFDPDVMFTHKKIKGEWRTEHLLFSIERVV